MLHKYGYIFITYKLWINIYVYIERDTHIDSHWFYFSGELCIKQDLIRYLNSTNILPYNKSLKMSSVPTITETNKNIFKLYYCIREVI